MKKITEFQDALVTITEEHGIEMLCAAFVKDGRGQTLIKVKCDQIVLDPEVVIKLARGLNHVADQLVESALECDAPLHAMILAGLDDDGLFTSIAEYEEVVHELPTHIITDSVGVAALLGAKLVLGEDGGETKVAGMTLVHVGRLPVDAAALLTSSPERAIMSMCNEAAASVIDG